MIPKFKAFCKRHKCIEEVFQITYLGDNDIKVEAECLSGYVGSDFILMQSTGLHDKNGVEIFEGDIVKPRIGNPFVVKHFIFGQGVFKTALITSDGHGFDGIYHGSLVEVIGNVEQNPELLEDV